LAVCEATRHVQAGRTDLHGTTDVSTEVSEAPHHDTQQHVVTAIAASSTTASFFQTNVFGKRSFSTAAPSIWNSLPTSVLHCNSLTSFKARLESLSVLFCFWLIVRPVR